LVNLDSRPARGALTRREPPGQALAEAISLARELASLPQSALRSDRLASYEQWPLPLAESLACEYRHGLATLETGELRGGLHRYASGEWRHGRFT